MKSYIFHLICALCLGFGSCVKEQPVVRRQEQPEWLQSKQAETIALTSDDQALAAIDFARPINDTEIAMTARCIAQAIYAIGRHIPMDVCTQLAQGSLSVEELSRLKAQYFYSDVPDRAEEAIRTRTVVNGTQHNYSTPGIYFYIITHLGSICANGPSEAINYFTTGISANTLTFADLNKAGKALSNQTALNILDFDPNLADFHYYTDSSGPIYYSGWGFEMVYEENVTLNGTVYTGPFGSQNGSNVNHPYMFATPYNETFMDIDGEQFPAFPLYDALWYFPIQGLGAVYVLGSDL